VYDILRKRIDPGMEDLFVRGGTRRARGLDDVGSRANGSDGEGGPRERDDDWLGGGGI
jgi:hypothetical protein